MPKSLLKVEEQIDEEVMADFKSTSRVEFIDSEGLAYRNKADIASFRNDKTKPQIRHSSISICQN